MTLPLAARPKECTAACALLARSPARHAEAPGHAPDIFETIGALLLIRGQILPLV
jgi:hypothetical protein